jgi:hypothetical protein
MPSDIGLRIEQLPVRNLLNLRSLVCNLRDQLHTGPNIYLLGSRGTAKWRNCKLQKPARLSRKSISNVFFSPLSPFFNRCKVVLVYLNDPDQKNILTKDS